MTIDRADPAFAALLADPRTALRPPRLGQPMAEYRQRLDAPMSAVTGPEGVAVEAVEIGLPDRPLFLRDYRPPASAPGAILFIHGGGFVIGSLDTHDALCRSLALASGRRVVAVAYRLAPESPFRAARDDCRAALAWLADNSSGPVALCGDSAGGYLAMRTALDARAGRVAVAALGLLYPVVDPGCAGASWDAYGNGHVLTRDWMRWAWAAYLAGADPADPCFALLRDDLSRLPPTLVLTAGCDPLRDEGEALAAAIAAAGGQGELRRMDGMIHGFASLPMLTARADEAIHLLADHFRQHTC